MPKKTQENRNMSGLRPLDTLSEEEAFAIRSKGGRASAAKREEERTLKSIIRKIMDAQPELSAEEDALLIRMCISKEKIDNFTLGVLQQVKNMREGGLGAFEMLMEQGGYIDRTDTNAESPVTIINDIPVPKE